MLEVGLKGLGKVPAEKHRKIRQIASVQLFEVRSNVRLFNPFKYHHWWV